MLVLEAGDHKGDVFETFLEEIWPSNSESSSNLC